MVFSTWARIADVAAAGTVEAAGDEVGVTVLMSLFNHHRRMNIPDEGVGE